MANTVHCATTY